MRGRGPRWLQRRDKEAPSPLDSPRLRPGRAFDDGSRTWIPHSDAGPSHPRSGGNSPQKGHAMIGTLARKRTHLVALAALLALVAAMFVVMPSASAAECGTASAQQLMLGRAADTSVTPNIPAVAAETCTITIPTDWDLVANSLESTGPGVVQVGAPGTTNQVTTITITPGFAGATTIKFSVASPSGQGQTQTREIERSFKVVAFSESGGTVDNPAFKITFVGDSDNIVKAGTRTVVKVTESGGANLTAVSVQSLNFYAKKTAYAGDPVVATVTRALIGPVFLDQTGDDDVAVGATNYSFEEVVTGACLDTSQAACGATVDLGDANTEATTLELFVPAGTSAGDYVVTASGTRSATSTSPLSASKALTVGTQTEVDTVSFDLSSPRRMNIPVAIAGQATAVLNLKDVDKSGGGAKGTDPDGYADDASTKEPAAISVGSGNSTELTLSILNASGKPAEASAITSIVISTTGGSLAAATTDDKPATAAPINYKCDSVTVTRACEIDISTYAKAGNPLPAALRVVLTAPNTPGTASVSAVVVAGGKVHTPDPITVTFYGPAASLEIGDASSTVLAYDVVGKNKAGNAKDTGDDGDTSADKDNPNGDADKGADTRDQITFDVDAKDKNGNPVRTQSLGVKITDSNGATVFQHQVREGTERGVEQHAVDRHRHRRDQSAHPR